MENHELQTTKPLTYAYIGWNKWRIGETAVAHRGVLRSKVDILSPPTHPLFFSTCKDARFLDLCAGCFAVMYPVQRLHILEMEEATRPSVFWIVYWPADTNGPCMEQGKLRFFHPSLLVERRMHFYDKHPRSNFQNGRIDEKSLVLL